MALRIGIVGLPNVGKSTTFNALTKAQNAEAANYPFCTVEPNTAIVPVPDERLDKLAAVAKPQKVVPSTIEFVDIAGLVKGASRGEGLGNQFLGNIRETSAIVHVVRCFDDDNVVHVHGSPNPIDDVEVIQTELTLADLEQVERRIERLSKQVKGDRDLQPAIDFAIRLRDHLSGNRPASMFVEDGDAFDTLERELRLLTNKKIIFAANVDENGLKEDNEHVRLLRQMAGDQGAELVKLCAKLEEEMAGLSDQERHEFLEEAGAEESGLEQIIHKGFDALGLMSFFTAGPKEVHAWTIQRGWTASRAAGVIHSDFEHGFIRAETISYEDYIAHNGEAGSKAAGVMRIEGRDYVVQDGDVMFIRFNV